MHAFMYVLLTDGSVSIEGETNKHN